MNSSRLLLAGCLLLLLASSAVGIQAPDGQVGVPYETSLTGLAGPGPWAWSIASGALPPGLSLKRTTGVISGTPTQAGTFSFTARFSEEGVTSTISIRIQPAVQPATPVITTGSPLPDANVGVAYSQTFAATDGTPPYVLWAVTSGALPAGLSLNSATGALTGTPTQRGTFSFTVTVTDSAQASASRQFTLTVGSAPPSITTTSPLPNGTVGVAYSLALAATGGTPPYSNWRVVALALPSGLTLDSSTGVISGTPQQAGTGSVQINVSDSAGQSTGKIFGWTVNPAALSITTDSALPGGTVGVAYPQTSLAATGGTSPYTWAVTSGAPPPGLTLNAGVLGGTPTQSGTFIFTVTATDSAKPAVTASKQFSLAVNPAALAITTASPLSNATAGTAYSQTLAATGGTTPYTWSVTPGALPPGLNLSTAGVLGGTPTQGGSPTFTVTVTDSAKPAVAASKQFTLTVVVPTAPSISVAGLTPTVSPAQQPTLDIQLSSPYSLTVTGTLTLTFTPDAVVPSNDPSVQFSTGGRTLNFTIPAGQTRAFPTSPPAIQTGTVAGRIDLTVSFSAGGQDITPTPAPSQSVSIARAAPKINSVQVVKTSGGFNVLVTGYSTPRQVTQAVFVFTATSGANLQTTQLTVPADSAFTTWYNGASSVQFGSSFLYTQPFTVTGNVSAIASVSVTLSNAVGSSSAVSANVPN